MSELKEAKEVLEMRAQLAAVRKAARGVKDSARNLRAVRKSDRLAVATNTDMEHYDSLHPREDTTKRLR